MSREFRPGEVIAYPYLWAWQHQRGETQGRKPRPVCVVIEPGQAMLGRFSKSFLMKVVALFAEARGKSRRQVSRTE